MTTKTKKKLLIRLPFNFKDRVVDAELKLESEINNQKTVQELMS